MRPDLLSIAFTALAAAMPTENEKRQIGVGAGVNILHLGLSGQCGLQLGLGISGAINLGQPARSCQQLQRNYVLKGNGAFDPREFGQGFQSGMSKFHPMTEATSGGAAGEPRTDEDDRVEKRQGIGLGGGVSLLNVGLNEQCGLQLGLGPMASVGFGEGGSPMSCQQLQRDYAIKGDDAFDPKAFGKAYQSGMDRARAQNAEHLYKRQLGGTAGLSLLNLGLDRQCGLQLGTGPKASVGLGQDSTSQCEQLARDYAVRNNMPFVGTIQMDRT